MKNLNPVVVLALLIFGLVCSVPMFALLRTPKTITWIELYPYDQAQNFKAQVGFRDDGVVVWRKQ